MLDEINQKQPDKIASVADINSRNILTESRIKNQIIKQNKLAAVAAEYYAPYINSMSSAIEQVVSAAYIPNIEPLAIEQFASASKVFDEITKLHDVQMAAFAIAEAWKQNIDFSPVIKAVENSRIEILSQQIQNNLSSLTFEDIQTFDVQFDNRFSNSNESYSKSFAETENNYETRQEIKNLKELIIELTEEISISNHQRESSLQENNGVAIQNGDTLNFFHGKFIPFFEAFLAVVAVLSAPKEIQELLQWFALILQQLNK